ncbi:lysine-rich arabinogalactan protein 19-like [Iris pallida]|uniref:Lysine-rich arabinogalactan protein 19-like n=1 Tax=Iris pallida TaxID=29817 RepID=A0AAX6GX24_IRIPA|nr:lysine-rich arabinogalactan protein 19-like [Iris pallida]
MRGSSGRERAMENGRRREGWLGAYAYVARGGGLPNVVRRLDLATYEADGGDLLRIRPSVCGNGTWESVGLEGSKHVCRIWHGRTVECGIHGRERKRKCGSRMAPVERAFTDGQAHGG